MDMQEAMDLTCAKALELHQSKYAENLQRIETKSIDQVRIGDIIAQDVFAVDDLPPFFASVMDGYALSTIDNLNEPFTIVESLKSLAGALPQAQQQE